jgi:hypothetical protein
VFDGIELPTGRSLSAQQIAFSDSASFSQHQKSQLSEQDGDMRIENDGYLPSSSRNSGTKVPARKNSPMGSRSIRERKNVKKIPGSDHRITSPAAPWIAQRERESSLSGGK